MPVQLRNRKRKRCGNERRNVRVIVLINRKYCQNYLYVFAGFVVKERTNRAVNHARHKNRLVCRTTLAFDKSRALYFSGGVKFLFVINHERKKINAFARTSRLNNCCQNLGVAVSA